MQIERRMRSAGAAAIPAQSDINSSSEQRPMQASRQPVQSATQQNSKTTASAIPKAFGGFININAAKQLLSGKGLAKPFVRDTKLSNIINDLYKGATNAASRIGSGSTADAVRFEKLTGEAVQGVFHSQKAVEYASALRSWLARNAGASAADRAAAEAVLSDLESVL